jgi:antirestriction protein ArdC
MSLASLKPYRGLNVLLLASQGYASRYWLTFNQATKLGGHVKKGEHGTIVSFWKVGEYEKKDTGEKRDSFLLRYYRVFNLEQTEGIAEKLGLDKPETRVPSIETCEQIVARMPQRPRMEFQRGVVQAPDRHGRDAAHAEVRQRRVLLRNAVP